MDTLATLNEFLKAENGNPVTMTSMWSDAGVDSFGTTMVFCDMDDRYGCFDKDWLNSVDWATLSVKDIVERVANESTRL